MSEAGRGSVLSLEKNRGSVARAVISQIVATTTSSTVENRSFFFQPTGGFEARADTVAPTKDQTAGKPRLAWVLFDVEVVLLQVAVDLLDVAFHRDLSGGHAFDRGVVGLRVRLDVRVKDRGVSLRLFRPRGD